MLHFNCNFVIFTLLLVLLFTINTLSDKISNDTQNVTQIINGDKHGLGTLRFDTLGNSLDLHDGEIKRFGDKFYLYGTRYGCGYELMHKPTTPFCGFGVARSTDLLHWENVGTLFDHTTKNWQNRCNSSLFGCYRPHVSYNANTKKYIQTVKSLDR